MYTYTIAERVDGFGAQYQGIISGIAYCYYKNYIYVHTPFKLLDHQVDIHKANEFIGIKTTSCPIYITQTCSAEVHWSPQPSIYYTPQVLNYIRQCYYTNKKPTIDVDIAIHIRRGDVTNEQNKERYTDNAFYIKLIQTLQKKYPNYTITIFSEGTYEDFKEIGLEEKWFKLNTDIFETFHSLVSAKVLIQSFSSFSYCAGILNQNTVYHYDSFWHKKLDHWLSIRQLV